MRSHAAQTRELGDGWSWRLLRRRPWLKSPA